jgi:hypothetical protein
MTSLGDPAKYCAALDAAFPRVSAAALAEVEQAVEHWRAAGWPDLAIGAVIAVSIDEADRRAYAVQVLRRVV